MLFPLAEQKVWLAKDKYHTAEKSYYENLCKKPKLVKCALFGEPAKQRSESVRPHPAVRVVTEEPHDQIFNHTVTSLAHQNVWLQKRTYTEAERQFYETLRPKPAQMEVAVHSTFRVQKSAAATVQRSPSCEISQQPQTTTGKATKIVDTSCRTSEYFAHEMVWLQKGRYCEAERLYVEKSCKLLKGNQEQVCKNVDLKKHPETKSRKKSKSSLSPPTAPSETAKEISNEIPREEQSNCFDSTEPSPTPQPPVAKFEVFVEKKSEDAKKKKVENSVSALIVNPQREQSPLLPTAVLIPTNLEESKHFKPKEVKRSKTNKKDRHRNAHKEDKSSSTNITGKNSLASEVARARQHIKSSLECIDDIASMAANNINVDINNRLNSLEKDKSDLKKQVGELTALVGRLELRLEKLEGAGGVSRTTISTMTAAEKVSGQQKSPPQRPPQDDDDNDDGVDLFGSDSEEEDAEAARIKEQRLAEYAARKSKKPVLIAKSNIILDVKPWDDETKMNELEAEVRKVKTDGLVWGASKLVPLAYGIHKLQISCVVEDEKVSVDWLQETIQEIEDYVQSVDIAAFNKV